MKRKILTLCLVLVLIISMSIPAFAAAYQGTYNYNGTNYTFDCSTSYTSTRGTAYMVLHGNSQLMITVYGKGLVRVGASYYTSYSNKSGYTSVVVYPGNTVTGNGVQLTGTVIGCNGDFYILDTCVKTL